MIRFGEEITDLDFSSSREWLETNGIGGFASTTITGCHTRRYHGLLVAATKPPVGRFVLLSKLEETLVVGDRRVELSTNRYPGVVHPQGYRWLKEFRLDPFPTFTFAGEGIVIEKTVFMVQGENTTVVEYRMVNGTPEPNVRLQLRPLIAFRDYHSLTHENDAINGMVDRKPGLASFSPYLGLPTLYLANNAVSVESSGHWYRNFEYEAERERGLDFAEDLFNPCVLEFDLATEPRAVVIASTEPRNVSMATAYRQSE